jgi:hypothetical protein
MDGCPSGKACHRSEQAAREAAIGAGRARTHRRPRVYLCAICHYWHLTSRPGKPKSERPRQRRKLRVPTPASPDEVASFFARYMPTSMDVVQPIR